MKEEDASEHILSQGICSLFQERAELTILSQKIPLQHSSLEQPHKGGKGHFVVVAFVDKIHQ